MEAIKNWGLVTVSTGYDSSATSIVLESGHGAKLPDPAVSGPFRLVWWNFTDYSNPADDTTAEIVTVTARSTDTLTVVRPASGNNYHGEGSDNDAQNHNTSAKTYKMALVLTKKLMDDINTAGVENFIKNGNFHNNSTNGYGVTNSAGDDWVNAGANVIGGGAFPPFTKQQLIDLLGISDGDIEGLWNLNEASGNAIDLSSNGYNLTDTNTVGSSDDGLIGKARDFESGSSEYFTIADGSCPNLELTGSRTFFALVKPESISANMHIMGKSDNSATNYSRLYISSTGKVGITATGLTTNTTVVSEVTVEAAKWYLVVGVIDISGTSMEIWVNGIKKSVTCSGASADTNGAWSVGRLGTWTGGEYFDGLIQMAGVLSVALSDDQVKRLMAATIWKGIKTRRATTDGLVYQYLDQHLVERLRGKTVTLVGKMYQDTANVGGLRVNDGSSYESKDSATTGEWVDVFVTTTISATATAIYVGAICNSADGNVWFKELALYEGSLARMYKPSIDDRARFPRLLKMDIPTFTELRPYQYEEKRWYTYSPTRSASGSMTISASSGTFLACFDGKTCHMHCDDTVTTAGTASTTLYDTLPIQYNQSYPYHASGAFTLDSSYRAGVVSLESNLAGVTKYDWSNWGIGATRQKRYNLTYPIS